MPRLSSSNEPLNKVTLPEHLHRQAFNNSFQPNIIFNVDNGNIISVNSAACKLLGYSKKELLTMNRIDLFDTKTTVYKQWLKERKKKGRAKADIPLIKKSGKKVECAITSVEFDDGSDEASSIMSIENLTKRISDQKKLDKLNNKVVEKEKADAEKLEEARQVQNTDWIKSVKKTTYDVIWDWNILTDEIIFGKGYEMVFGYKLPSKKISFTDWLIFLPSEDATIVREKIQAIIDTGTTRWKESYQFTCPDGTVKQFICRANNLRDNKGAAVRMVGVIHDLSLVQQLEESLDRANEIKEREIIEAIITAKEMERSNISKELHDNVNQLLGASVLYLDMARSDKLNVDIYLKHSEEYIRSAISDIRALSKGLTEDVIKDFGLCEAIDQATKAIIQTQGIKISCFLNESVEDSMSEAFKLNTYRIIQEQLNNIVKHAKASEVQISLSSIDTGFILTIGDDGIGFDTTKKSNGIGLKNIVDRASLYKGTAKFNSYERQGCMLVVDFPVLKL